MGENSGLEPELVKEINKRIEAMESPSYEPVPTITKSDIFYMIGLGAVCIIGLIWGAN